MHSKCHPFFHTGRVRTIGTWGLSVFSGLAINVDASLPILYSIHLLIGMDIYHRIIKEPTIQVKENLYLYKTVLGPLIARTVTEASLGVVWFGSVKFRNFIGVTEFQTSVGQESDWTSKRIKNQRSQDLLREGRSEIKWRIQSSILTRKSKTTSQSKVNWRNLNKNPSSSFCCGSVARRESWYQQEHGKQRSAVTW